MIILLSTSFSITSQFIFYRNIEIKERISLVTKTIKDNSKNVGKKNLAPVVGGDTKHLRILFQWFLFGFEEFSVWSKKSLKKYPFTNEQIGFVFLKLDTSPFSLVLRVDQYIILVVSSYILFTFQLKRVYL